MKNISTKKMTVLALFCALAVVLCLLMRIPLVPSMSFLTYDPKDVIIGMGVFLFGPVSAALISAISSAIELLFRGGNIIDWLMNVISSCSFACTAAVVYKRMHSKNGAFIGLCVGIIVQILVMLLWNYVMDPIYFGMPREAVVGMLPAIALFNLLKGLINAGILLLIYKPVSNALHKSGALPKRDEEEISGKKMLGAIGTFAIITAAVLLLAIIHMI